MGFQIFSFQAFWASGLGSEWGSGWDRKLLPGFSGPGALTLHYGVLSTSVVTSQRIHFLFVFMGMRFCFMMRIRVHCSQEQVGRFKTAGDED